MTSVFNPFHTKHTILIHVLSPNNGFKWVKMSLTPSLVQNFIIIHCETDEGTSCSTKPSLRANQDGSPTQIFSDLGFYCCWITFLIVFLLHLFFRSFSITIFISSFLVVVSVKRLELELTAYDGVGWWWDWAKKMSTTEQFRKIPTT